MTGEVIVGWVLIAVAVVCGWCASPPFDGLSVLAILAAVVGVLLIAARGPERRA